MDGWMDGWMYVCTYYKSHRKGREHGGENMNNNDKGERRGNINDDRMKNQGRSMMTYLHTKPIVMLDRLLLYMSILTAPPSPLFPQPGQNVWGTHVYVR